jgi:hypothetical protein
MQIRRKFKTDIPENNFDKAFEKEMLSYSTELASLLNGGLSFSDNFDAEVLTIADSGAANSENTVAHTLKRAPTGFIVVKIDKAGQVYFSGTAFTDTDIYVKCSVANCAISLLVF